MRTDGADTKQLTKGDTTDWLPLLLARRQQDPLHAQPRRRASCRREQGPTPTRRGTCTRSPRLAARPRRSSRTPPGAAGSAPRRSPSSVARRSCERSSARGDRDADHGHGALPDVRGRDDPAARRSPHDGHSVALTPGGTHRAGGKTRNIKKETWTAMGQGAQIAWAPDGASVYWADDSGKERSRLVREPVVAGLPADDRDPDKILLVDLGGKRSRERFPRYSRTTASGSCSAAAINDLPRTTSRTSSLPVGGRPGRRRARRA